MSTISPNCKVVSEILIPDLARIVQQYADSSRSQKYWKSKFKDVLCDLGHFNHMDCKKCINYHTGCCRGCLKQFTHIWYIIHNFKYLPVLKYWNGDCVDKYRILGF